MNKSLLLNRVPRKVAIRFFPLAFSCSSLLAKFFAVRAFSTISRFVKKQSESTGTKPIETVARCGIRGYFSVSTDRRIVSRKTVATWKLIFGRIKTNSSAPWRYANP
jgi:hypothetical protein